MDTVDSWLPFLNAVEREPACVVFGVEPDHDVVLGLHNPDRISEGDLCGSLCEILEGVFPPLPSGAATVVLRPVRVPRDGKTWRIATVTGARVHDALVLLRGCAEKLHCGHQPNACKSLPHVLAVPDCVPDDVLVALQAMQIEPEAPLGRTAAPPSRADSRFVVEVHLRQLPHAGMYVAHSAIHAPILHGPQARFMHATEIWRRCSPRADAALWDLAHMPSLARVAFLPGIDAAADICSVFSSYRLRGVGEAEVREAVALVKGGLPGDVLLLVNAESEPAMRAAEEVLRAASGSASVLLVHTALESVDIESQIVKLQRIRAPVVAFAATVDVLLRPVAPVAMPPGDGSRVFAETATLGLQRLPMLDSHRGEASDAVSRGWACGDATDVDSIVLALAGRGAPALDEIERLAQSMLAAIPVAGLATLSVAATGRGNGASTAAFAAARRVAEARPNALVARPVAPPLDPTVFRGPRKSDPTPLDRFASVVLVLDDSSPLCRTWLPFVDKCASRWRKPVLLVHALEMDGSVPRADVLISGILSADDARSVQAWLAPLYPSAVDAVRLAVDTVVEWDGIEPATMDRHVFNVMLAAVTGEYKPVTARVARALACPAVAEAAAVLSLLSTTTSLPWCNGLPRSSAVWTTELLRRLELRDVVHDVGGRIGLWHPLLAPLLLNFAVTADRKRALRKLFEWVPRDLHAQLVRSLTARPRESALPRLYAAVPDGDRLAWAQEVFATVSTMTSVDLTDAISIRACPHLALALAHMHLKISAVARSVQDGGAAVAAAATSVMYLSVVISSTSGAVRGKASRDGNLFDLELAKAFTLAQRFEDANDVFLRIKLNNGATIAVRELAVANAGLGGLDAAHWK
eukprot:c17009_g1_i1.p1 GENE.c17009_g1_i1~~c17009_g1_i1.p1  ORF type:complete len:866 (+),score=100.54 c17009_g1_i1:644-3241(+)